MPDLLKITRAGMRALVGHYGCYDAVAEMITARFGIPASKGTISKKMAGNLEFTVADVVALEDATGQFPITQALVRRMNDVPQVEERCLLTHGANITKEAGEAVCAILSAAKSSNADERAEALQQIEEAQHALRQCRKLIEDAEAPQ